MVRAVGRVAAASAIVAFLLPAGVAFGREVEGITVSEGRTVTKDYGPIAGNEPPVGIFFGGTFRTPATCRDANYCDTIDLTIQVPASYTGDDFFKIDIILSWEEPAPNNLNMYLHREDGSLALSSATSSNPETITIQDPSDSKYQIVVSNAQGANTGYRLSVSFVPQGRVTIREPSEESFGPPASTADSDRSPDGALAGLPSVAQPEGGLAAAGPRFVESAGPDGPASRERLAALAQLPVAGNSLLPLAISSIVATIAAVGLGVYLFLRGRRESEL